MLFAFAIAPGLRAMSPAVGAEFFAKVTPKATRFFIGTSTMTVVFGLILLYVVTDGNLSLLSFTSAFGTFLPIGIVLGVAAYIEGILWTAREVSKIEKIMKVNAVEGSGPPPDMAAHMKALGISSLIGLLLLILALASMVTAGFY